MTTRQKNRYAQGFTLIEMLLVVSLIALLIALLLPSLSKAREATRRAMCMSNMRQMGNAVFVYSRDFDNWTPNQPRTASNTPGSINDGTRNVSHGQNKTNTNTTDKAAQEVVGKVMKNGYMPEKSEIVYCPSRVRNARYGPDSLVYGWVNWSESTVEYSYQHRLQRRLNKANSSQIYGSELGITDNYYIGSTPIAAMSVGAEVSHGDDYYNLFYFDLSSKSFIDKNKEFGSDNMLYWNSPGRVLNKMESLD